MRNTKIRDLIADLEGFGEEPKWDIKFYSENPDGTISLTVKDNREMYEAELAEKKSQEAAHDNNN